VNENVYSYGGEAILHKAITSDVVLASLGAESTYDNNMGQLLTKLVPFDGVAPGYTVAPRTTSTTTRASSSPTPSPCAPVDPFPACGGPRRPGAGFA
jgi:hypothetical protein